MATGRVRRIIFSRFALLNFGCICALALVMSFALTSFLTRAVSEWEWENTAALVRREVRMAGLERVFTTPGSPEDRKRWGPEFSSLLTSLPEVVRAKVWDSKATILWSDESQLIGRQFLDNDELRAALAGKLEVEIQTPTKAEQSYERSVFTTLAEIYVPIFSNEGRVVGVVEVYKTPQRLLATIGQGRIAVWSISFAGALLLFLVMHPLLTLVYRKEVQEETLRAETGRLEIEVADRTKQLYQAQKMEAVGLLAGGIAHDFNNLLTVITGHSQMLLQGRPDPARLANGLTLIEKAASHAAILIRQLLAFGRKQVLQRRVLNLNSVVVELEKMLQPLIGERITLAAVLDPALGPVNADPGQVEQVILNLAVNARDAMPKGGRIVLKTENVQLDAAAAARVPGLQAGGYTVLAVSDDGTGMDPATQARIFEPFFTTKEVGKGTGLGLSTVYGIVQQHGGSVSVDSALGRGTTFKIYLPHVEVVVEAQEAGSTRTDSGRLAETILVVDDDEEIRSLVIDILRAQGYATLAAADGVEAMGVAARHQGPLHLLLTDVVMPQLSGWELARQLSAVRPEMKVLYMTGYSEIAVVHDGASDVIVLQKPFMPDALVGKVREALQAARIED